MVSDSVDKIVDDYMNQLLPAQSPYQISPTLRLDMHVTMDTKATIMG